MHAPILYRYDSLILTQIALANVSAQIAITL